MKNMNYIKAWEQMNWLMGRKIIIFDNRKHRGWKDNHKIVEEHGLRQYVLAPCEAEEVLRCSAGKKGRTGHFKDPKMLDPYKNIESLDKARYWFAMINGKTIIIDEARLIPDSDTYNTPLHIIGPFRDRVLVFCRNHRTSITRLINPIQVDSPLAERIKKILV